MELRCALTRRRRLTMLLSEGFERVKHMHFFTSKGIRNYDDYMADYAARHAPSQRTKKRTDPLNPSYKPRKNESTVCSGGKNTYAVTQVPVPPTAKSAPGDGSRASSAITESSAVKAPVQEALQKSSGN